MIRKPLILTFALGVALVLGCATSKDASILSPSGRRKSEPVAEDANGNMVLVISNQSYETPSASILVEIYERYVDGGPPIRRMFSGTVPVENQHHSVSARYRLEPGEYVMLAHEFKTETMTTFKLDIPEQGRKFVNIWFWNSKSAIDSPFPHFSIDVSDEKLTII